MLGNTEHLGAGWRRLLRLAGSWAGTLLTSALIVGCWGYFLYQGVLDPLGGSTRCGRSSGSRTRSWPRSRSWSLLIVLLLVEGGREWYRIATGRRPATLTESPYVRTRWAEGSQ